MNGMLHFLSLGPFNSPPLEEKLAEEVEQYHCLSLGLILSINLHQKIAKRMLEPNQIKRYFIGTTFLDVGGIPPACSASASLLYAWT